MKMFLLTNSHDYFGKYLAKKTHVPNNIKNKIKKNKKNLKNLLTTILGCDILTRLSQESSENIDN